jgi:hypothetical protein
MMQEIDEALSLDCDDFSCATSMNDVTEDGKEAGSILGQADHSGGSVSEGEGTRSSFKAARYFFLTSTASTVAEMTPKPTHLKICLPGLVKPIPGVKLLPVALKRKWGPADDIVDLKSSSADGDSPVSPSKKVSKKTLKGSGKTQKKEHKRRSKAIKPSKDGSDSDENTAPIFAKAKRPVGQP